MKRRIEYSILLTNNSGLWKLPSYRRCSRSFLLWSLVISYGHKCLAIANAKGQYRRVRNSHRQIDQLWKWYCLHDHLEESFSYKEVQLKIFAQLWKSVTVLKIAMKPLELIACSSFFSHNSAGIMRWEGLEMGSN